MGSVAGSTTLEDSTKVVGALDRRAFRFAAASAAGLVLVLSIMGARPDAALAAGRCSSAAAGVEQRVAEFWQCVASFGPSDLLTAEDLGQWARNVIERAPGAGIRVVDFGGSTAEMQNALERASAGVPPAPPKSADVESRIALFWHKVNALGSCDLLAATDLGQWSLNVINRDPSKRIRVDDFRTSTAGMQAGLDRAYQCSQGATPGASCPAATGPYAICGRITRSDTGAAVAGARVHANVPHDPDSNAEGLSGADGRYTVTVPKAHNVYLVWVDVDPPTGLGALYFGGVGCSYDAAEVKTFGHVSGIDVVLRPGHWIRGSLRDAAGAAIPSFPSVMRYVASAGIWCDVSLPQVSFDPKTGAWDLFVAEGTYRIKWDPANTSLESVYPAVWFPSALTASSARDVVVNRDVIGVNIVVPKGYMISGTVRPAFQDQYFWVQVVTMDGGRVSVAREGYLDYASASYSFVVAPGTYKVRLTNEGDTSGVYFYARNGARTFDAGASIVVTNANVTGVDIAR